MSGKDSELVLHTYYKSSCSGRLRIALNLKGIPAKYTYVHLGNGEQHSSSYADLNPSRTVPTLTQISNGKPLVSITQSLAALEYLEEAFPDKQPLLPPFSNPVARAQVRSLTDIIVVDAQPLTSRSTVAKLSELGANALDWQKQYLGRGLQTFESLALRTAGRFSVGGEPTLADVCLVPCIWNAEHYGVDLDAFPTVMRIFKAMMNLEAVQRAHWQRQEDCPPDNAWL